MLINMAWVRGLSGVGFYRIIDGAFLYDWTVDNSMLSSNSSTLLYKLANILYFLDSYTLRGPGKITGTTRDLRQLLKCL